MWVKDVEGSLINLQHATSIEIEITISSEEFTAKCEENPEFVVKTLKELPCHQVCVVNDGERRIKSYLNEQCSREDCQHLIDKIGASLNGRELLSNLREESETGESRFLPTS
tara:strand:- start:111 stop:446 length:336 start_codon:yes stop_codon:yes gene_type:complete